MLGFGTQTFPTIGMGLEQMRSEGINTVVLAVFVDYGRSFPNTEGGFGSSQGLCVYGMS